MPIWSGESPFPGAVAGFEASSCLIWGCCPGATTFTFIHFPGTNPRLLHDPLGELGYHGEPQVIGKQYFVRQAAILFGIAKATKDPQMSAALMDKAADIKSKVDELEKPRDLTARAPDIQSPTT